MSAVAALLLALALAIAPVGPAISVGAITELFRHDALTYEYNVPSPTYPFDVAGGRFLLRLPIRQAPPQPINVILNWQALVKAP